MTRNYRPPDETPKERPFSQPIFAFDKFLAIYARQSTKEQVINNREAYDQQTKGLLDQARELGWDDDHILVYIENERKDGKWRSASGGLRIDQREHLQALVDRIDKNEVKTVLVWAVDRLFRDETMIQPAVFADTCKEHHCLIITTDDLFDFNNDRRDDGKQFRDAAQAAADYVTKHVKRRMLPARALLSLRGVADSRKISVGYIVVDRQRYLHKGGTDNKDRTENPNYRRLVVYEPHARVIRYLFCRYRELGGNLRALYREIDSSPYVFPFFEDLAHAKYIGLTKNQKGYTITRGGLTSLLTNVVYIGWWYYKGKIVSKTNHEPIVSEDDFWYAFNRLSPLTIDGDINHRPTSRHSYTHDGTPPPEALLDGIITSEELPVYVLRSEPPAYAIIDSDRKHSDHYKVSIRVPVLDTIFVQKLLTVLEDPKDGATLHKRLTEVRLTHAQQLVSVDAQITEVKQQIARAERDKRIAEEEDYEDGIRDAIRKLKSKKAILAELEQKKKEADVEDAELVELMETLDLLFGPSMGWYDLTLEKKQRFIRLSTESITLSEASTHFLKLAIEWTGGRTDVGYIWRKRSNGGLYTEEEDAVLRELYPVADRAELLDRLPHRSWTGILIQAGRLGLSRHRSCGNSSSLHIDVSRNDNDILEFLGVEYEEAWPDKLTWWVLPAVDNVGAPS